MTFLLKSTTWARSAVFVSVPPKSTLCDWTAAKIESMGIVETLRR